MLVICFLFFLEVSLLNDKHLLGRIHEVDIYMSNGVKKKLCDTDVIFFRGPLNVNYSATRFMLKLGVQSLSGDMLDLAEF